MPLRTGKLPLALLEDLMGFRGAADDAVRLGPGVGEDAAAVDLGDRFLVLKTDPITFAEDMVGWYAVHINANDVATLGCRPRWFQATILLPEGSEEDLARAVFRQIHEACLDLEVAITGGHTEVTPAVNHVVVVGDMQGLVSRERLVTTSGAREGDVLILTKAAGLEGTAILARERRRELSQHLDEDLLERAASFLRDPGISVVPEALMAAEHGATSMHDPTEGGVAMGIYELSWACGREILVEPASIPVARETVAICDFFGLNPLGLISSGALLVTVPPSRAPALLDAYRRSGIKATVIGRVGGPGVGVKATGPRAPHALEPSETDEITRVL